MRLLLNFFIIFHFIGTSFSSCVVRVISNNAVSEDDRLMEGADLDEAHVIRPLQNNTGKLSSGQFALSNYKCQIVFLGAAGLEHVRIVFKSFRFFRWDFRYSNSSLLRCEEFDHLSVYVLVGSRMSKVHDFCGDELPPPILSTNNLLTVDYLLRKSGARVNDSYGFEMEYSFLSDFGARPDDALTVPNSSCSFLFNGSIRSSGDFWSPNHPGLYPRQLDCEYTFHGEEGQIVIIHFEYFDVEGFGQCESTTHSDFVLFSNYKTIDRTNRRYCGTNRPLLIPIQSESNYFRMQFFTNDIFDATGFYAHYQFLSPKRPQSTRVKITTNGVLGTELYYIYFVIFVFLINY